MIGNEGPDGAGDDGRPAHVRSLVALPELQSTLIWSPLVVTVIVSSATPLPYTPPAPVPDSLAPFPPTPKTPSLLPGALFSPAAQTALSAGPSTKPTL
jgi:hypothetical protein